MSPSLIIATHICDEIQDCVLGSNVFVGHEPESPDDCVTLYDYGNEMQSPVLADDWARVQVRVRDLSYEQGYLKSQEISLLLNATLGFEVSNEKISGIWQLSSIIALAKDKLKRNIFVVNYRALICPSNPGNRLQY